MIRLVTTFPESIVPQLHRAVRESFDLHEHATVDDTQVARWLWLELGCSVFGRYSSGSDRLARAGVEATFTHTPGTP